LNKSHTIYPMVLFPINLSDPKPRFQVTGCPRRGSFRPTAPVSASFQYFIFDSIILLYPNMKPS